MATPFPSLLVGACLVTGCLGPSGATSTTTVVRLPDGRVAQHEPSSIDEPNEESVTSHPKLSLPATAPVPPELLSLPAPSTGSRYDPQRTGQLDDPEQVVDRHRPAFRRCFESAAVTGRVSLAVEVNEQGAVSSVRGDPRGPVPREVVECLEQRVHTMRFDAPRGGPAELPITVVYLRQ